MTNIKLEKTEIIARQILLYFVDFFRVTLPLFDSAKVYRIPFREYDKFRALDKLKFSSELYRLKREGVIKKYIDEKGVFIELTNKGRQKLRKYLVHDLTLERPKIWDKKWRLVIFDIPDDKKLTREVLRSKLNRLGFIELQESVYVYPFDCLEEINLLKTIYYIKPHVQYILADRIETEINLIKIFYDNGILTNKMIK